MRASLVTILLVASNAEAEPYKPANPDVVLMHVKPSSRGVPSLAETSQEALEIARSEMAAGRVSLDERHFGRAKALMFQALPCLSRNDAFDVERCVKDARNIAGLIAYADVLQHEHDFVASERVLDRVLSVDRAQPQALVMRASVRLARGSPREALKDCTVLIGVGDGLVATACIAQAMSMTGRLEEAYALLETLLSQSAASDSRTAWALAILAELAERKGAYDDAIRHMERALRADSSNAALRIQAADLLLRAERYDRIADVLSGLPRTEPVVLREALVAKRTGSSRAAALAQEWRALVSFDERFGVTPHLRDVAIGELQLFERPSQALRYAQLNWQQSKEVEDARVLVAAAIASRRPQSAAPVLRWIDELGLEDVGVTRLRAGIPL